MVNFSYKGFTQNFLSGTDNFADKEIFVSNNSILKNASELLSSNSDILKLEEKSVLFSFESFKNFFSSSEEYVSTSNQLNDSFEKYLDEYGSKKLLSLLKEDDFEPGYRSKAYELIEGYLIQNTHTTKDWINKFYLKYTDNPHILIGILNLLKEFDYNLIYPQAQTIAIASFSHKDIMVKEMAVRCFEKWEDIDSLKIIKNFEINVVWIEEYLNQVVEELTQ